MAQTKVIAQRLIQSGTAFPTVDIFEGMLFLRTDEGILYRRTASAWTPEISSVVSNFRSGLKFVSASSKVATFAPGQLDLGNLNKRVAVTANFTLDLATGGLYLAGTDAANHWVAAVTDSAGNFKLTTDSPTISDAAGNTDGDRLYRIYAGTLYRYVRWLRTDGSGNIRPFSEHPGGLMMWDAHSNALVGGTSTSYAPVSVAAAASPTSRLSLLDFSLVSGGAGDCFIRATGSSATGNRVKVPGSSNYSLKVLAPTDSSQSFDYKLNGGTLDLGSNGYFDIL